MDDKIKAKMYKGMPNPTVELLDDEASNDEGSNDAGASDGGSGDTVSNDKLADVLGGVGVSLDNLGSDAHNQSYGMAQGSTGCVSNPGGPSC